MQPLRQPDCEIFIGLVGPVGTDLETVRSLLGTELNYYGYRTAFIKLSGLLCQLDWEIPLPTVDSYPDERTWLLMDAGTRLRSEFWKRGDALALLALAEIMAERRRIVEHETGKAVGGGQEVPSSGRTAFILDSLKHPAEVATLRAVYGSRFFLLSAYAPPKWRQARLEQQIADARGDSSRATWVHTAEDLIRRDESERNPLGQKVRDVFHRADLFVEATDRESLRSALSRLLEIVFGQPFRTPTRDEAALFAAAGASRRSAEPGRQVGAALVRDGSILSVGTNEVPAPGGGTYWEGADPDHREWKTPDGVESNTRQQVQIASEIFHALHSAGLLSDTLSPGDPENQIRTAVLATRLGSITEFGRAVHAEMSCLLDAAARGVPVSGATLYATTFPCHNCARHIVAAGISRVVYVAPYPKSLASELHSDSASFGDDEPDANDQRTRFVPFVGVAPRRYLSLFDAQWREDRPEYTNRKDDGGRLLTFDKRVAVPVFEDVQPAELRLAVPLFRLRETRALELLQEVWRDGPKLPAK